MGDPLRTFQYCPHCATPMTSKMVGDRKRRVCPVCDWIRYRNPVVGVAVVVFIEDEIVLGRTGQKGYLHGQWCIPCGHVEYDEHVRDAAVREFEEETGLVVDLGGIRHVDSNFFEPWGRNSVGIWFDGEVTGGELRAGGDVIEVGTFPLDDLPLKIAYKSDMRVLKRLCEERGFPEPNLQ